MTPNACPAREPKILDVFLIIRPTNLIFALLRGAAPPLEPCRSTPQKTSFFSHNVWSENRLQELLDRYRHATNVRVNLEA